MEKEDDLPTLFEDEKVKSLLSPGEANYTANIINAVRKSILDKAPQLKSFNHLKSAFAKIDNSCIPPQEPYSPLLAPQTSAYNELVGLVACIAEGVRAVWNYYPRNAQLIALVMLLTGRVRRTNKARGGRLIQMNTGEGKTIVVAMSGVAFCLLGHRVDVVTSSESLAERDATGKVREFVQHFKLTVDHITDEVPKKEEKDLLYQMIDNDCAYQFSSHMISLWCGLIRDELKKKCFDHRNHRPLYSGTLEEVHVAWRQAFWWYTGPLPAPKDGYLRYDTYNPKQCYRANIVYGTAMGFQGDLLRHELKYQGTRDVDGVMRPFDVVICDECDALMSDGALHSTQLTSDVFGMSYLNLIIATICAQFLGARVRGIKDNSAENGVKKLTDPELVKYVTKVVTEALQNGKEKRQEDKVFQIRVPPHLIEFALEQCPRMVESVRVAFFKWRESYEYRIKDYDGEGPRPVPINIGTGEAQVRMHYSNGLHEALQIKHKLPLGQMTLCDNQRSNKLMFQEYNYIFGLSGTLGSAGEHEYLKTSYSVDIRVVAPFKRNKRRVLDNEMYMFESDWKKRVTQVVTNMCSTRAVLIICKFEHMVKVISDTLKSSTRNCRIITYVDKESQQLPKKMDIGDVLISTNLAGRGTDLEITKSLERNGGLHTILAFLADNERIRDQAFGRSGRCGQPGSAQVIGTLYHSQISQYCDERVSSLTPKELYECVEQLANEIETTRLNELPTTTLGPDTSERCFIMLLRAINEVASGFRQRMKNKEKQISPSLDMKQLYKEHDTILRNFDDFCIGSVLERFAFWKKQHEEKFDEHSTELLAEFESKKLPELKKLLDTLIERIERTDFGDLPINPYRLIDKAINHVYAKQHGLAIGLYNSSIHLNPDFCAFAHFNKALSLIEQEKFDEANAALDAAHKLIEEGELPRICAIATMLSNLSGQNHSDSDDALAKQLELHTTILSAVLTNIGEAKQTMEELRRDEHTPGAYFADSTDSTKFSLRKDIPSTDVRMHYRNLGLQGFIKVYCKKKKSSSFWDAVLCGLIGVVQVVGGALLTYMSAGLLAQVGYALIMEGISDIAYAIEHGIKGDFKWSNWATKKAVSLAVTALTLGLGGFSGVANGVGAFQLIGNAVVKELVTRGIDWLVGSVLQEVLKKIVEWLGNELKGLMRGTVTQMLNSAGDIYNKCIDAALLLEAIPEYKDEVFPAFMDHLKDVVKNVLGQPSVLSTIGNVAETVLSKIGEIKSSNNTVMTVVTIVSQVANLVGLAAKASEIIRVISGQGSTLKRILAEMIKKVNFDYVYTLADTAKEHLRKFAKSDYENLINSLQDAKILKDDGQLAANYGTLLDSARYENDTKNKLREIFDQYQKTSALKKLRLNSTKREAITGQVIDGWSASVTTYVLDTITKKMQGATMEQLRNVANKFSSEFVQSSQEVQGLLSRHNFHQQSITRLLNTNGNPLAIVQVLSSVTTQISPNSPLAGTINDIATFTNVVNRIQHGDFASAMNLLGSTSAGQELLKAVSASQLGQNMSQIVDHLGELPHQKLQMMASASLSLLKGDIDHALVDVGQVVDCPEISKIVSISQHLQRGDTEKALQEAANLANVDLNSLPLPRTAIKDLKLVVDATVAIKKGDYSSAIGSLAKTKLGEEVVKMSQHQPIMQVKKVVTQLSEIKNVTTLVQNMNLSSALELAVSSKLLPGDVLPSKEIASIVNACQAFLNIHEHVKKGSLADIVQFAASLIDVNSQLPKAVQTLLSQQWFKDFPKHPNWPASSLAATTDECATLLQFLTDQCKVARRKLCYTLAQCRSLFDIVKLISEAESDNNIEKELRRVNDDTLVAVVCWLAFPNLLQNRPQLVICILDKLFSYFKIECSFPQKDMLAFIGALQKCILIGDSLQSGNVDKALVELKGLKKFEYLSTALSKVKRVTDIGTTIIKGDLTETAHLLEKQPEFKEALQSIQVSKQCITLKELFNDFIQTTELELQEKWNNLILFILSNSEICQILSLSNRLAESLKRLDHGTLRHIANLGQARSLNGLVANELNLNREMANALQVLFDMMLLIDNEVRAIRAPSVQTNTALPMEEIDPEMKEALRQSLITPNKQISAQPRVFGNTDFDEEEALAEALRQSAQDAQHNRKAKKAKVGNDTSIAKKDITKPFMERDVSDDLMDEEIAEAIRRNFEDNRKAEVKDTSIVEEDIMEEDLELALAMSLSLTKK